MILVNTLVLKNQKVVEQEMMDYRAKEFALNVEMISDYQNPGFMEVSFPVEYNFTFERTPSPDPPYTNLTLHIPSADKKSETEVAVRLEPQSYTQMNGSTFCIIEDLPEAGFFSSFPDFLMGSGDGSLDVEDGDNDYEDATGTGNPEDGDQFVQVKTGGCPNL